MLLLILRHGFRPAAAPSRPPLTRSVACRRVFVCEIVRVQVARGRNRWLLPACRLWLGACRPSAASCNARPQRWQWRRNVPWLRHTLLSRCRV